MEIGELSKGIWSSGCFMNDNDVLEDQPRYGVTIVPPIKK